jgi:replicative DNA helicase
MANETLEKKVLSSLLNEPELAKRLRIKEKWFLDRSHRELAFILLNTPNEFTDFSEIEFEIKRRYPKSFITEEYLHQLKFEQVFVSDLEASLKTLEKEYIQHQQKDAMIRFLENQTTQNKEAVQDWIRAEHEAEQTEDDGRLDIAIEQLLHDLEHENEGGLKTFASLDKILGNGLIGGMLFVLGARPGIGKTAFAINMALKLLQNHSDIHVDVFTLEMTDYQMLVRFMSLMANVNGYKFSKANTRLKDDEKERVKKHAMWIKDSQLRVYSNVFKLSEIERTVRQNRFEHQDKPYIAFVDYLGLIDAENSRVTKREQIGMITRKMKLLTNELKIPIVLLSQLSRAVEGRQDKTPTLSDLRESGDIEQDANVVGFLSEHEEIDNVTTLTIAKNREGANGQIDYLFHKASMHFEEYKE